MMEKKKKNLYKRLLSYCRPYLGRLWAALACMLLAAIFGIIPPWLLKNVVDDVLLKGQYKLLDVLSLGIILLYVGKGAAGYGQTYLMNWVGQRVILDIRLAVYDHVQHLSFSYLNSKRVGELLSRITNDVAVLQDVLSAVVIDLVVQGVTFVGILAFLLFINWRLTLATFVVLPLAALIIDRASKRLRAVGHAIQEQLARLSAVAEEALSSIRIVRSFATEELEFERFKAQSFLHFKALMHGTQIRGFLEGVVEVVLITALCFILWLGGRDVIEKRLTVGALIAFLTYLGLLVQPIRVLSRVLSRIQQGLASAERVFEILDEPGDVPQPSAPLFLRPIRGHVVFDHVWFAYEPGRWVLKDVCLELKEGEKVAVIGPTGTGKSTLGDLIPRFYDPQMGSVFIDGHDVRTFDLKTLRRQIGIVQQDPILMKGTLAFNIAYGFPEGTEEKIREAARIAGIAGFIESLPKGYETEVGERGVTLSGGQRQRIAIARAIIRDPRILIFDEATSSLDVEVEQQILETLRDAMRGRTALVIAHRLSTVRDADRIVLLEEGHIEEEGNHQSLMGAKGHYYRLFQLNSGDGSSHALT